MTQPEKDRIFANVALVAECLAMKGYQAEHPDAPQAEADAWADAHWHLYLEDAWQWLRIELPGLRADRLERAKEKRASMPPATIPPKAAPATSGDVAR